MIEAWPEWVEGWVKLRDYGQVQCPWHKKHYNKLYCVTCRDKPMCAKCWGKSQLHKGDHHQILQAYRCSRRVGIEVKGIRRFLNVRDIQVYAINDKRIVFLNPNTGSSSSSSSKHGPPCLTCKRKLITSEYSFCSIACKGGIKRRDDVAIEKKWESEKSSRSSDIDSVGDDKLVEERLISANTEISSSDDQDQCSSSSSFSFRKRSRKGIPRRAPLK